MYFLRKAVSSDADAMAYVHVTSWQETYKDLLANHVLNHFNVENRERMWSAFLQKEVSSRCAYVAVSSSGKVVGIASWNETADQVELLTLYVLSEFQRQSVGQSLFKQVAKDAAKRNKPLVAWVLKENSSTLFYEKMGLKCIKSEEKDLEGTKVVEVLYSNRTQ